MSLKKSLVLIATSILIAPFVAFGDTVSTTAPQVSTPAAPGNNPDPDMPSAASEAVNGDVAVDPNTATLPDPKNPNMDALPDPSDEDSVDPDPDPVDVENGSDEVDSDNLVDGSDEFSGDD